LKPIHNIINWQIQRWIPECHFLLMKMKPLWAKMVPLKKGESLQQIKRFFNSLARLMSISIRQLVYGWLNEWLTTINLYKVSYFKIFNLLFLLKLYFILATEGQ